MSSSSRTQPPSSVNNGETLAAEKTACKSDMETLDTTNSVRAGLRRQCRKLSATLRESGSESSGDEWQPSPPQAPSPKSIRIPAVSPPTGELNVTTCLSSSARTCNSEELMDLNTSGKGPNCSETAGNLADDRHSRTRRHACEVCGETYVRKRTLRQHVDRIHKKLRLFVCEICDKDFVEMRGLQRHIDATHKKLREYECEDCGRAFAEKSSLNWHIDRIHRKVREFACKVCGKIFTQNGDLYRHVDGIHKQLREHTCDLCGKAFAQKTHLKKHIDGIHKQLREFLCVICGKYFTRMDHMKTHTKRFHTSTSGD
ncbi:hypothetical protein SprV_0100003000 [Sparganum proliferum]